MPTETSCQRKASFACMAKSAGDLSRTVGVTGVRPCEQNKQEIKIEIKEGPATDLGVGAKKTLHATGRVPDSGGKLRWSSGTGTGGVRFHGDRDKESVTVEGRRAGTVVIYLEHYYEDAKAMDMIRLEVKEVEIALKGRFG